MDSRRKIILLRKRVASAPVEPTPILPYIFDAGATSYFKVDQVDILNNVVEQSWVIKGTVNDTALTRHLLCTDAYANRLYWRIDTIDRFDIGLYDGGYSYLHDTTWAGKDELEHLFVFTYDGTNLKAYVDNTEIGTINDPDFISRTANRGIHIGADNLASANHSGNMSVIHFYNKGLTPAEIADLVTDISNLPADHATSLVANFAGDKTTTTWTSEVGGFTATNQGGVTLGT